MEKKAKKELGNIAKNVNKLRDAQMTRVTNVVEKEIRI